MTTPTPPHDPIATTTGPAPTLAQDLGVLAWLENTRDQLSAAALDYLCGALLEWSMIGAGQSWPDPHPPEAGRDCDHLELLVTITNRWIGRISAATAGADRWELARIGRELSHAIAAQRDSQALAEAKSREMLARMPWLAWPPPPVQFAGGWL